MTYLSFNRAGKRLSVVKFLFLFALIFLFFPSTKVWAQASVNVSTIEPVYRDIDKLVGNQLIDKIIVGQRPYSRMEIARLAAQAIYNMKRIEDPLADPNVPEKKKVGLRARKAYVEVILHRLMSDYHDELVTIGVLKGEKSWYYAHPLEYAVINTTVADSPGRTIPPNGLGSNNAIINPLLQYKQGRHLVNGGNLSLETTHWVTATPYFAFYARPRFQLAFARDSQPDDNKVFVLNLYSKVNVKNFELEVGRDNVVWGQGLNAGQMLSNNPRGLDMVKISNDDPFFFPWVFKYLGAQKLTFFYADLGPEQEFPNSYLTGYKWSMEPVSFLEVGVALAVQGGGQGSPPASLGERVRDVLPFGGASSSLQVSNKFAAVDLRIRVPTARGLELYGGFTLDDTHSIFSDAQLSFIDDGGWVASFYIPRLVNSGKLDLRMEYHYTGIRFYRHQQFTSGWTLNRFILGDDLGPNAMGGYAWVNWDIDPQNILTFNGAFESRSNDIYISLDNPFRFERVQDLPSERRYRVTTNWLHRVQDFPLLLQAQLGYERVQNFQFAAGNNRDNFLGEIAVQFQFDRWLKFPR